MDYFEYKLNLRFNITNDKKKLEEYYKLFSENSDENEIENFYYSILNNKNKILSS